MIEIYRVRTALPIVNQPSYRVEPAQLALLLIFEIFRSTVTPQLRPSSNPEMAQL
jgi:hypothetical protein